jgi:hypothetical protein
MMARKGKKRVFSKVKAVKANARERVGQPRPERVIDEAERESRREEKHKPRLEDLLRDE